ncbi:lipoprotein-releasing ABC transporter permease subunit [candidate division WOR-3 bacterium]|nr:lipoprotein-releasing ABC transporter permease subunit [candidate division WOR-3 bacterium]
MRFELFMARRYLRGRGRRIISGITAIAMGGVFVGVAAILIVLSVENGFHQELKDRILGATPHIVVARYSYAPIPYPGEGDSLRREVVRVPGVVSVAPFVYAKTLVRTENAVEGVVIRGVDPEHESEITGISGTLVQGEFAFDSNGVVIGVELARTLGLAVGDRLNLASPFGGTSTPLGFMPRTRYFRVNGIFDCGMYEYNSSFVYLSLTDIQQFLSMEGMVTGFEVRVRDVYASSRIARRITRQLGYPFRATDWIMQNRNLFTALKLEKVVTFIVLVLIVLVAAFNIIGMLTMMVMRKTREIGILKAMGAKSATITRIFVLAGGFIGFIGTTAGAAFGLVACWLLNKYRFVSLPGDVYFIKNLPVQVLAQDFALVCLAAIVITFAATIYPALKAAKLVPLEAIRYE